MEKEECEVEKAIDIAKLVKQVCEVFKKKGYGYEDSKDLIKKVRSKLGLKTKKPKDDIIRYLEKKDVDLLLQKAKELRMRYYLIIKSLYQTGVRVSELVNLKVENINFDERKILIEKGKGGKSRYVLFKEDLASEISSFLNDRKEGYLFLSNRDDKYSPRAIRKILNIVADKSGLPRAKCYPHALRHSFATHLLNQKGMTVDKVQLLLGHSKLETTQIYAKTILESVKKAYDEVEF